MKTMKYAKKMKLVEIDDNSQVPTDQSYLSLPSDENVTAPRILSILDNFMNAILNRHDINDGEKWTLYNQALQRYLNHIKKSNVQNSVNQQSPNNIPFDDQDRRHTPDTFNNRISDHNISGVFPMKTSIENISEPIVRDFFEQARMRDENPFSPSTISAESLDDSIPPNLHKSPKSPLHEAMSISIPTSQEARNVTNRRRKGKRGAAHDMTRIHPYKVTAIDNALPPQNLEPRQLYRDRRQPQSNFEFYWESTKAK